MSEVERKNQWDPGSQRDSSFPKTNREYILCRGGTLQNGYTNGFNTSPAIGFLPFLWCFQYRGTNTGRVVFQHAFHWGWVQRLLKGERPRAFGGRVRLKGL